MPAIGTYGATVAHDTISAILTSLMDGSTIGFIASALVLGAFGMKDMVNLRTVAICSNVAFIVYALALNLPPILILHVILLPLNGWRLMEALKQRSLARQSVPNPILAGVQIDESVINVTSSVAGRRSPFGATTAVSGSPLSRIIADFSKL